MRQTISRDLGDSGMEAGRISIRLDQDIEGLREFGQKSLLIGDPAYFQLWTDWEGFVGADLTELQALQLTDAEARHREDLLDAWRYYGRTFTGPVRDSLNFAASTSNLSAVDSAGPALVDRLIGVLNSMATSTDSLRLANGVAIEQHIA